MHTNNGKYNTAPATKPLLRRSDSSLQVSAAWPYEIHSSSVKRDSSENYWYDRVRNEVRPRESVWLSVRSLCLFHLFFSLLSDASVLWLMTSSRHRTIIKYRSDYIISRIKYIKENYFNQDGGGVGQLSAPRRTAHQHPARIRHHVRLHGCMHPDRCRVLHILAG